MQHKTYTLYSFILIFSFLSFALLRSHGFTGNTAVKTDSCYKPIQSIAMGDHVVSYDSQTNNSCTAIVTNTNQIVSSTYYRIRFGDTHLVVHPEQRFWLVSKNDWIAASELVPGDSILTLISTIVIDEISEHINTEPLIFYRLTVGGTQTFCVTEREIVVHNFSPELIFGACGAAATLVTPIIIAAPVAVPIASAIITASGIGFLIWKFFEGKKEQARREQEFLLQEQAIQQEQKWLKENTDQLPIFWNQQPNNQQNLPDIKKSPDINNSFQEPPKQPEKKKENALLPAKRAQPGKNVNPPQVGNLVRATINGVTKIGTTQQIAAWINTQKSNVFSAIQPALKELVKNAKQMTKESIQIQHVVHIFSKKHLNRGLMQLGEHVEEICLLVIQLIKEADATEKLIQGTNTIRTFVNNIPIEIHFDLEQTTMRSFNAFVGHSNRVVSHLIELLER